MPEWTADSNDALELKFVRSKEDTDLLVGHESELVNVFHPKFTYPIFGEEEKIYGFEDLAVKLHFASGSLKQFLSVSYSAKLGASTADDPEKTLYKFIPPDYSKDEKLFQQIVEKDALDFKPMGKLIHSYTRSRKGKGKEEPQEPDVAFEVYHANWETPGFLEYHRRMQIFILLYIEAGSYIQEDEEKWEFMLLFERRRRGDGKDVYSFVGYSSLYPFYFYPDSTRLRLSQFVITPPYQKQGHGAALYTAIYEHVLSSSTINELTVEDPSEDFEDLRDKVDLQMLLSNERFVKEGFAGNAKLTASASSNKKQKHQQQQRQEKTSLSPDGKGKKTLDGKGKTKTDNKKTEGEGDDGAQELEPKLGPPVKKIWAERWRKELKLAKRQYDRLIEMLILRALDDSDEAAQRAFRLQVKARLKVFNFETLAQMEQDEQYEKLEETFQSVKEGYERILGLMKK